MINSEEFVKYIPYQQSGEPARRAALTNVECSLEGFTKKEIQIIGHLVEAAELLNPILRDQFEPATFVISDILGKIKDHTDDEKREKIENYLTILNLQNSPYALLPRKNHLLDITAEEIRELITTAGIEPPDNIEDVIDLMTKAHSTPDKANFYPSDLTEEEYDFLKHYVNSSVIRDDKGVAQVIINEKRYQKTLAEIVDHLCAARDLTEDLGFRLYLDAKILELETGSEEARRLADYTWVKHNSSIDIVISTALEVYLDNYKNARGAAAACVTVRNSAAEELLAAIVERVPRFESEAPWKYKKEEIDPERLPKLKFVDTLNWTADYVTGPFTVIAQSLPNDEWVIQNVGTVNMVYMNTGKAVHRVAGNLSAKEFLTQNDYEEVSELIYEANQLHSALHEIGHTTGRMDEEHSQGQPKDYLEEYYSYLEETRAELFGLWSLKILEEDGIVQPEMVKACYSGMLISMITSLKFDPVQAHNMARNCMFHYFEEKEIIQRILEDGKIQFSIDYDNAHNVVSQMLGMIGNLKAEGDKASVIELQNKYVYTDDLKSLVEERTSDFPLGRGLIFPNLKKEAGQYQDELVYPESFNDQPKFKADLK